MASLHHRKRTIVAAWSNEVCGYIFITIAPFFRSDSVTRFVVRNGVSKCPRA